MMRMKSKKQLTMAVALALALGGSVPVWAENLNNQKLTKGDWKLQEELKMENSQVTADQVSLDGTTIPAGDAPVSMSLSSLEGKKGIGFSNLKASFPYDQFGSQIEGVNLAGSSLVAPAVSISTLKTAEDNKAYSFLGVFANVAADYANNKNVPNQLKTDLLHVDGVSTDTALQVYGALIGPTYLSPYTEGGTTNVTVENVSNETDSPDGTLAFGLGNSLALFDLKNPGEGKDKDIPFVVTGKTQIRNISSAKGSAVGTVLYGISGFDMEDSHTDFHDLEISDIHGGDLSVGLYGGMGVVNVENADINMTGKQNEYAGLYTASEPDYQSASLQQFAIAGPFLGNINLSNPEGIYTINGNVLADTGNHLQMSEAQYQFYKKMYEDPKVSEGNKEYLKSMVDALAATIQYEQSTGKINLAGHLKLYGDVYAKNGGTVNIHLQEGSYFEGQADDYADYDGAGQLTPRQVDVSSDLNKSALGRLYNWKSVEDQNYAQYGIPRLNSGTINVTMDPGSTWQTRGKSFLTSLTFNHGGLVDTRKGHGVSVAIGKLTGEGGTFLMDFSKDAAKSDMLYVRDLSQSGVQHIQAYLLPDTKPEDLKGLRFATTGGDDYKRDPAAKFDVSLAKDQGINNITLKVKNEKFNPDDVAANEKWNGGKNGVGTYKPGNDYVTATFSGQGFTKKVQVPDQEKIMEAALVEGKETTDGKGNLLGDYLKEVTVESPVKEGTNWFVDEAVVTPSDSGKVIKKSMQLNYMNAIYGIYTDSLEKRLGEARYSGDGDGLWARVRHDRVGRDSLYEANNTMTEVGYDWRNDRTSFGRHIQGAALDYMDGSADYKEVTGSSDSKRYGLWFYDTRLGDKGHYTDLVAKYGRLQNKYTLYPEMGDTVKGNYHHDYWSLSFEYGRKKPLASDWFIEPQAQLQYTYLSSASYRTSQDTQVHLAGTDSLISRLGFRLGRDISDRTSFYMTGDFFHEFLGDQDVSAWDRTGRMDVTGHNDGSWYNAGVGFSTRVGKNSYAYASFDRSFGPHVDRTWTLEAGVNFRF